MVYLIEELKKQNHQLFICTHMSDGGGLRDLYYNLDVKIYNLSRKHKLDLGIVNKLKSILITENVDIVVLFQPQNFIYFRMAQRSINKKIKQVGLLRAMGIWLGHQNRLYKIIDDIISKKLIQTSELVIANSNAIKRKYDKQFKLRNDLIKVVHNSSDFTFNIKRSGGEIRKELGISEDDTCVIMVARLDPWKDFDTLIKAAAKTFQRTSSIKYVICGGGPLESSLRTKIQNLSLEKNIFLVGEKKNVYDYINASDISVLVTKGEGFSNAIMESMALAKPVIATNVGGNPELLGENGLSGYLIKAKAYQDLAQIILDLHNNSELRNLIGAKAKERVFRLCDRKANMENIKKQFEILCAYN